MHLCDGHSGMSGAGRDLQTPAVLDRNGTCELPEHYSLSICLISCWEGHMGISRDTKVTLPCVVLGHKTQGQPLLGQKF